MRTFLHQFPPVCVGDTLAVQRGIVDLWYCLTEDIDNGQLIACRPFMAADEHERFRAIHFERDRQLFLASRLLLRTVLSRYVAVKPKDWHFAIGDHGRPHISSPDIEPMIHFNLANTPGLVVCIVSIAHDLIGVDAEWLGRKVDFVGIADRHFSPSEARDLREGPTCSRARRFLSYWTLKESYIKARGVGLSLPLQQFSFSFNDRSIKVSFDAPSGEDETRWRFALLEVEPSHIIALAAETGGATLSLRTMKIITFSGPGDAQ